MAEIVVIALIVLIVWAAKPVSSEYRQTHYHDSATGLWRKKNG